MTREEREQVRDWVKGFNVPIIEGREGGRMRRLLEHHNYNPNGVTKLGDGYYIFDYWTTKSEELNGGGDPASVADSYRELDFLKVIGARKRGDGLIRVVVKLIKPKILEEW